MPSLRDQRVRKTRKIEHVFVFPWSLTCFCCVTLGLLQASLVGMRWLTIVFILLGASLAGYANWVKRISWQRKDQIWLGMSGFLAGSILLILCFAPGFLNTRWEIDQTIPRPDPNELTVVPRDKAMQKGRPYSKEEAVDAAIEAFRQDDVVIRIESARISQLPGKGDKSYLLVQFRIVNTGQAESVAVAGFNDHGPALSDDAGRSFTFLEPRVKQIRNRSVVFDDWGDRKSMEIPPRGSQDFLLVFEPPVGIEPLQLEVNSEIWGRKGLCRFRIAGISPSKT